MIWTHKVCIFYLFIFISDGISSANQMPLNLNFGCCQNANIGQLWPNISNDWECHANILRIRWKNILIICLQKVVPRVLSEIFEVYPKKPPLINPGYITSYFKKIKTVNAAVDQCFATQRANFL
jgi:hypothetical protein